MLRYEKEDDGGSHLYYQATRGAGHDVARLEEHAPDWLAAKTVIDSDSNEYWV